MAYLLGMPTFLCNQLRFKRLRKLCTEFVAIWRASFGLLLSSLSRSSEEDLGIPYPTHIPCRMCGSLNLNWLTLSSLASATAASWQFRRDSKAVLAPDGANQE